MTPEERIQVINECIQYLKDRPGRKAIHSLIALRDKQQPPPNAKINKPSKDHPWR